MPVIYKLISLDPEANQRTIDINEMQLEDALIWIVATHSVTTAVTLKELNKMSAEDFHVIYGIYEKASKKMVDNGIFTSKYDFRQRWVLVPIHEVDRVIGEIKQKLEILHHI